MNLAQTFGILLAIVSSCAANNCPEVCVLDDLSCVTKGGFKTYSNVVNGIKDLIDPMDPLRIEDIKGKYKLKKFTLTNITLVGLKNCEVTKLQLNVTTYYYKQYLHCPQLVSTFTYETQGLFWSTYLRKNTATVTVENYYILNQGSYGVFVNDKDHNPHFFIQPNTLQTTTSAKGKVEFTLKTENGSNADVTEAFGSKCRTVTKEYISYQIIKRAMPAVINGIDIYIRSFLMGEVLPQ